MTSAPDDRDPEERDPGLARERTSLAWTRTAISFAALGGVVLKVNVITGLTILVIAPLVWQLGRISGKGAPRAANEIAVLVQDSDVRSRASPGSRSSGPSPGSGRPGPVGMVIAPPR